MPAALPLLSGAVQAVVGAGAAIQTGLGSLGVFGGALLKTGLSVGLSFAANALAKSKSYSPQTPEDVQNTIRQGLTARQRHYGQVMTGGRWVYVRNVGATLHVVMAIGQGEIAEYLEFWIDSTRVTMAGPQVITAPWYKDDYGSPSRVRIETRRGLSTETAYSGLTAKAPEWTSAHRGDGVASVYYQLDPVLDADYQATYPNGINTSLRCVIRGSKVLSIGGGDATFSDNAADVIRDYITHSDGMGMSRDLVETPLAAAGWLTAYHRANEYVALAGGGQIRRYLLWGSYSLEERPADVLARMLAACDGRLVMTSDGGLTLDIGAWEEPSIAVDETMITGFSDLSRGMSVVDGANTIRATYTDPGAEYQTADAEPYVDEADVSVRGEISSDVSFIMAPTHSQCRRLMKIEAYRRNPAWSGVFECNLKALNIIGERAIRLRYPAFGIDEVVEISEPSFILGGDMTVTGIRFAARSMPEAARSWSAAAEEGTAPAFVSVSSGSSMPAPDAPSVTIASGVATVDIGALPAVTIYGAAQYRLDTSATWTDIEIAEGETTGTTGTLTSGETYEFRSRYVTEQGRTGPWSDITTKTA